VVATLRDAAVDVVVCYLPVGSEDAAKFYAQCAIDAGCAFVNALPVFIAGTESWAEKFRAAGLPIIGDDIKSQVGATITHRVLAKLFEDRGVVLDRTMQLNVGGNMDFMNMLERDRLESKKISKTQSVTSQVPHELGKDKVHIGPSDYVAWLDDRKWAYRPAGGPGVRRRPAEPGVQARGLGLAELRGGDHRRGAGRQDRQGPRDRRPGAVGLVLLHEVAPGAVLRRRERAGRSRLSSPARPDRSGSVGAGRRARTSAGSKVPVTSADPRPQ
jgi:hypothetical protein